MLKVLTQRNRVLSWPARPRRGVHPILGPRRWWLTACGCYRIETFPQDGYADYSCYYARPLGGRIDFRLLKRAGTLRRAKALCEGHAKRRAG